jgi:hypothetical protein
LLKLEFRLSDLAAKFDRLQLRKPVDASESRVVMVKDGIAVDRSNM